MYLLQRPQRHHKKTGCYYGTTYLQRPLLPAAVVPPSPPPPGPPSTRAGHSQRCVTRVATANKGRPPAQTRRARDLSVAVLDVIARSEIAKKKKSNERILVVVVVEQAIVAALLQARPRVVDEREGRAAARLPVGDEVRRALHPRQGGASRFRWLFWVPFFTPFVSPFPGDGFWSGFGRATRDRRAARSGPFVSLSVWAAVGKQPSLGTSAFCDRLGGGGDLTMEAKAFVVIWLEGSLAWGLNGRAKSLPTNYCTVN